MPGLRNKSTILNTLIAGSRFRGSLACESLTLNPNFRICLIVCLKSRSFCFGLSVNVLKNRQLCDYCGHCRCTLRSNTDLQKMTDLARAYPPMVRALCGYILEDLGNTELSNKLFQTINPFTKYKIGLPQNYSAYSKWGIL